MFIRFATLNPDQDSRFKAGIFTAAYTLKYEGYLPRYEYELLVECLSWFDRFLKRPDRFSRSRRPNRKNRAICWFKSSAKEHIEKAREMIAILENHGVLILMLKTDRPGYVVYEDEFQIVAEPFADVNC